MKFNKTYVFYCSGCKSGHKTIVFVTGTRADFGKQKLVIKQLEKNEKFDVHVFVTGMHMLATYGHTYLEVERENFKNTHKYINAYICTYVHTYAHTNL